MNAQKPYNYQIIDDFLPLNELENLRGLYSALSFKEIHTDLFRFTQSDELAGESELFAFQKYLDKTFNGLFAEKNTFYTIFASYYRRGDYLLCHDDMVDERLWAFTFYLEDFSSGELVLYENDCITQHKRIDVRANRLVIFEVGECSFHEVKYCILSGRKAITGWINSKERKNVPKTRKSEYFIDQNIETFNLGVNLDSDFLMLEFSDIPTNEISRRHEGPLVDRRVFNIIFDKLYVPIIPGYCLILTECLLFKEGCYIMCNDKINKKTDEIYDVFIFSVQGPSVKNFITYVDQNSMPVLNVDAIDGQIFMGNRNNNMICICRTSNEVFLKHFMYEKST